MRTGVGVCLMVVGLAQWAIGGAISYISPKPNAVLVSLQTNIILRSDERIDPASVSGEVLMVRGDRSGVHAVTARLSDDGQTMIFNPVTPFEPNEKVSVAFSGDVIAGTNAALTPLTFSFTTTRLRSSLAETYEVREDGIVVPRAIGAAPVLAKRTSTDSLPSDFPRIKVDTVNNPAPGNYYLTTTETGSTIGEYIFVVDNAGQVVQHQETHGHPYDLKQQPNGLFSYAEGFSQWVYAGGSRSVHRIVDSTFAPVDSVRAGNGYDADSHDFRMLPNGHVLLHAYDIQYVDVSALASGGNANAIVVGSILQELDLNRDVVFQWRSWDYIPITDTYMPIAGASFDYIHVNAYDMDADGNILASFRNISSIVKINRATGAIMWYLGGKHNQFTFIGENAANAPTYFTYQHSLVRLPNGNFMMFDNGNNHTNKISRAVEYAVDEVAKTATMVWEYRHTPDIFAPTRGSVQRLANGNTVIGWGSDQIAGIGTTAITEVRPDKSTAFEMEFVDSVASYRALKYVPAVRTLPAAFVLLTDLVASVDYAFRKGDSVLTGISMNFSQVPSGYNAVQLRRYEGAPLQANFDGIPPFTQPRRWVIKPVGMSTYSVDITFDSTALAPYDRKDLAVIYSRPTEGVGTFTAQATTYDPVNKRVTATVSKFGEFVIGVPTVVTAPPAPTLALPTDGAKVDQTHPVAFRWLPAGQATGSHVQIASDSAFTSLVRNDSTLKSSNTSWAGGTNGARYYWRARVRNTVGPSPWSARSSFTLTPPFVTVTNPAPAAAVAPGSTVIIRWDFNAGANVNVQLLRAGVVVTRLADSVVNSGRYIWKVAANVASDTTYTIRVQVREDTTLFGASGKFKIGPVQSAGDTPASPVQFALAQNFPNPFNPATTIRFTLAKPAHVSLVVYSLTGQAVATVIDRQLVAGEHEALFAPQGLASGIYFYRLTAGDFTAVRKLVLLR